MATEPVARGRSVAGVDVYDGYALERRCVGEDDEEFQAQTQHLLEQVYDVIDVLSRARLGRTHTSLLTSLSPGGRWHDVAYPNGEICNELGLLCS